MISEALKEYQTGEAMSVNNSVATEFAEYMLEQIAASQIVEASMG